eukprot:7390032-Prymnesium_polylepis.1
MSASNSGHVCYGSTGRRTRTGARVRGRANDAHSATVCVLTGYGDEAREHGTRARTRERHEGATCVLRADGTWA